MAKRSKPASDTGVNDNEEDASFSDGSVKSTTARCEDSCHLYMQENELQSPAKTRSFTVIFADLFKAQPTTNGDGSCTYIKPSEDDILEIEELYVDKVETLWGHCLLGCFVGRFPGVKAVRNLVDK